MSILINDLKEAIIFAQRKRMNDYYNIKLSRFRELV